MSQRAKQCPRPGQRKRTDHSGTRTWVRATEASEADAWLWWDFVRQSIFLFLVGVCMGSAPEISTVAETSGRKGRSAEIFGVPETLWQPGFGSPRQRVGLESLVVVLEFSFFIFIFLFFLIVFLIE